MKKIINKISLFSILLFVLIITTACGKSNSIIGTWNYYKDGDVSNDIYYTFEKGGNGSYTYAGNTMKFTYEDRGTKVIISYDKNNSKNEFDYSIKDGILTIKDSFNSDVTYKRK